MLIFKRQSTLLTHQESTDIVHFLFLNNWMLLPNVSVGEICEARKFCEPQVKSVGMKNIIILQCIL